MVGEISLATYPGGCEAAVVVARWKGGVGGVGGCEKPEDADPARGGEKLSSDGDGVQVIC